MSYQREYEALKQSNEIEALTKSLPKKNVGRDGSKYEIVDIL
jgi:hypothetical protein